MTTTVSPGSSPTVVYNRDGTTLDTLAATGDEGSGGAQIVRYTGTTVVLASTSSGETAVILPHDAEIGDVVEVLCVGPSEALSVVPHSGDSFYGGVSAANFNPGAAALFRYVAANKWSILGA